jgi:hypothetical protein
MITPQGEFASGIFYSSPDKPYTLTCWVNQPSTLQAHHYLHGLTCTASFKGREQYAVCTFPDGTTRHLDPSALAPGPYPY